MRRDVKIECEPYLAYVRSKPCVHCGSMGVDAHHIVAQGQRQSKRNDFLAAPLCREHHARFHTTGNADNFDGINLWRECMWLLIEYLAENEDLSYPMNIKRGKI
jgi:hypothetical protein